MKKQYTLFLYGLLAVVLWSCGPENKQVIPVHLRTEYLTEPIGIDATAPRFTWEYEGEQPDFRISRSEIRIGTSPKKLKPYADDMVFSPQTRYYWNVTVWDQEGKRCRTSKTATFETGKLTPTDWKGRWITDSLDKETEAAPLFRKVISANKPVKSARAHIASAGYHELFINGERVGDHYLDPGYTHFDKRILIVTHDITSYLAADSNAFVFVLGNGWFNEQSVAVWNFHNARWRDRPTLLCDVVIEYQDGTVEEFVTNESWKTATGPYTYNNLYSGDRYDSRLEEEGWLLPGFQDEHWQQAVTREAPAALLTAQQMPPIRITERIRPDAMVQFNDSVYVYAFPKNFAGFCELKVKGEAGTRIRLLHGEILKPDGRLDQGNIDVYYHPVKTDEIFQTDEFILKGTGEEELYIPSFTYHGFQYVEVISSKPVTLTKESLCGLFVHTDVPAVGSFSCSDPMLNKIWDATMLAYRGNLHSIPTDCPQREKNGWTADAHISADLGLLGFDGITFYEKWMRDFIDNQRPDGSISGIIPSSGWGYDSWIGPVWDAALFIIPNALYNYYGDDKSIRELYPTMKHYLDYLKTREEPDGSLGYGLGDWVYWNATTNTDYTSTAYYYLDNLLMARFAEMAGENPAPYQDKADRLKELINQKHFNPDLAQYAEGTQTAQALALYLDLVPESEKEAVAARLAEVVRNNNHFLDFGLLGSKTVPAMLTQYGYVEDAMAMLTKTEAPSWGYWVETMGYTTLPETWTLSPVYKDASLNHVFMGDIAAWMMNNLAGINYDAEQPGFRHILLTPHFVKELGWVKGRYHSVRGLIVSEWKREGERIVLHIEVPAGCTATVRANQESKEFGSGKHSIEYQIKASAS